MPRRLKWTKAQDEAILAARLAGKAWDTIAWQTGQSKNAVAQRARELREQLYGAPRPLYNNRDPLPPGSPASWEAITAGTLLEGVPYRSNENGYDAG